MTGPMSDGPMSNGPISDGPTSNVIDELERRLTDELHGIGRLAPDTDGWEGIHHGLDRRRRARARARVAGVAVVLVAVVAVLVPLSGRGDRQAQVASDPQRFPRLVLDLPGYELAHADSSEDVASGQDVGQLLVYGDGGPGLLGTGAVVFVRLVPAGAPYGIGDADSTTAVDIAGRDGRLLKYSALSTSLGWPRADGTLVHLVGAGVGDGALADMGRSVETALAQDLAPPTELDGGLTLRRSGRVDTGPSRHGEVTYTGPDKRTVELRLTSGGPAWLDDLVLDRLASAGEWKSLTVDGRPAVMSTYADGPEAGEPARAVMWSVRPGVVAELVARGLSDDEIGAALGSITEVDEAEWGSLVAKSAKVAATEPPVGSAATESAETMFVAELCKESDVWLRAVADGGTTAREEAASALHDLGDKGRATGLDRKGDIVVIADRVAAGAAAGDVDAVRAERSMCP